MNYGGGYGGQTSYGNYGGDTGGGYTNYGGSQGGSQASPSGGRSGKQSTLRPVTIKQVLEAQQPHPDMEHTLDNHDLTHITFVARIMSSASQPTNILFKLEDGTGVVEAKYWTNKDATNDIAGQLQDGSYVRVMGSLKTFNGKKHVSATVLKPVTDFNEVAYHLLEATSVHLALTRGPAAGGATGGGAGIASTKDSGYGTAQDTHMGGTSLHLSGFSAQAQKVYEVLMQDMDNNDGLVLDIIATRAKMSLRDVMMAKEELQNQGKVYTTIDDNHIALMETD